MTKIDNLFFFIYIFSCLSVVNLIYNFIINLTQSRPNKFHLNKYQLIFYGVSISYIITYIIKN